MNKEILEHLQGITSEERAILDGRTTIDRDLYMKGHNNTVNAQKLLSSGKLITIRPPYEIYSFPGAHPRLCGSGLYVRRTDDPYC